MDEGQYHCPVEITVDVIGGKWKPRILWQLREGPRRFSAIKKEVRGITQKMLTQQLRELEADGVIRREMFMEMPVRVEYSLTDHGQSLYPVLRAMAEWGYAQHPDAFCIPLSRTLLPNPAASTFADAAAPKDHS